MLLVYDAQCQRTLLFHLLEASTPKRLTRLCKGLHEIGVTAEMIRLKEKEIQDIFQPQHSTVSNQTGDSTLVDRGQSSDAQSSLLSSILTKNELGFLVGPKMLAAAEAGDTKCLISILEDNWNINFIDDQKETALHKAAANGHTGIVKLLLERSVSIEETNKDGRTPLHSAARKGHTGTVELLLERGASIDAVDDDNRTPLHHHERRFN